MAQENEFWPFSNIKMNITSSYSNKVDKNGVICLVSLLPSWVMVLKLSKKVHFLQFCADHSQKRKCVKVIYVYGSEGFYYSLSESDMAIGVWATVHEIFAIKISRNSVKILILDQIAFAAVVYFGHVFRFCRLIKACWNGFY